MARDYNLEYQDNTRKYAYNFDYILRDYMMQSFLPFLVKGKALELGCYKGEFTKTIAKHFSDVTVVEASDELINCCKPMLGDVNFSRSVDGNDVSAVQAKTRQPVGSTNFWFDVNVSGAIDGNDVSLTQSKTRTSLP